MKRRMLFLTLYIKPFVKAKQLRRFILIILFFGFVYIAQRCLGACIKIKYRL